jgi:2-polyprenyl-3-methyl-5-hydroxy-6-metoxy-1,4-benzoquinol methylase
MTSRSQKDSLSIHREYEQHGVHGYYEKFSDAYRNPHEAAIRLAFQEGLSRWQVDLSCVLDLACGSGEITLALMETGCAQIDGIDPYTAEAYQARTGKLAETFTFEQIADGALEGRRYSLIVCSYALHLLSTSRLPVLAYQLTRIAPALIVVSPHKRPNLREVWGWRLEDELVLARVRVRLYQTATSP